MELQQVRQLHLITRNSDRISSDYDDFKSVPRPGHADYVSGIKYSGFADMRGSGHFSGRITWGLVAAGVIAKLIVRPAVISAKLISAGGSDDIVQAVEKAMAEGDSIGGIVECTIVQSSESIGGAFLLFSGIGNQSYCFFNSGNKGD